MRPSKLSNSHGPPSGSRRDRRSGARPPRRSRFLFWGALSLTLAGMGTCAGSLSAPGAWSAVTPPGAERADSAPAPESDCPSPDSLLRASHLRHRAEDPKLWNVWLLGWNVAVAALGPEAAVVAGYREPVGPMRPGHGPNTALIRVSRAGEEVIDLPPGATDFLDPRMVPAEDGFHIVWGETGQDESPPGRRPRELWHARWDAGEGWTRTSPIISTERGEHGYLLWNEHWGSVTRTSGGGVAVAVRDSFRDLLLAFRGDSERHRPLEGRVALPGMRGGLAELREDWGGRLWVAFDLLGGTGPYEAAAVPLSSDLEPMSDHALRLDLGGMRPEKIRWLDLGETGLWLLLGGEEIGRTEGVRFGIVRAAVVAVDAPEGGGGRMISPEWEDLPYRIHRLLVGPEVAGAIPFAAYRIQSGDVSGLWHPTCGLQWGEEPIRTGPADDPLRDVSFRSGYGALMELRRFGAVSAMDVDPPQAIEARFLLPDR